MTDSNYAKDVINVSHDIIKDFLNISLDDLNQENPENAFGHLEQMFNSILEKSNYNYEQNLETKRILLKNLILETSYIHWLKSSSKLLKPINVIFNQRKNIYYVDLELYSIKDKKYITDESYSKKWLLFLNKDEQVIIDLNSFSIT